MKFSITLFILSWSIFTYSQTAPGITENLILHRVIVQEGKLIFEGNAQSYAELRMPATLNSESGSWCFGLNIIQASTGPGQSIISKTESIGSYSGLHIFEDSGRLALQIKNNTNSQTLTIKSDYLAGSGFHWIAVTYENNITVKLFIDGQLKNEAKAPYFNFSKNPLRLGFSLDNYWKPFGGEIKALEIMPKVLSAEEISNRFTIQKINEGYINYTLYPNPSQNSITIVLPFTDDIKLVIFDAGGKEVLHSPIARVQNFNITTAALAAGIYTVQISGNKNYEVKKLVITKN